MISGFVIVQNEEELLPYCLESFLSLGDLLEGLSVVDNNSTDATLDILHIWRDRLPITLQHHRADAHHGHLRNLALRACRADWVLYLDSDETVSRNFADWLRSGDCHRANLWQFHKYSTVGDRYHHAGGDGPSQRLFRNFPGIHFPQTIHTEPTHDQMGGAALAQGVWLFDHTSCKSEEALWAKGWRYQWAMGTPGIGPPHEYIGRVQDARNRGTIQRLPDHVCAQIFTGPGG